MKKINVSTKTKPNIYTFVDNEDFKWLNQWKWEVSTKGYVVRKANGHNITMSRLINKTPIGFQTDHINRNKLDNRRENLRTVTNQQNHFNKGLQKNNKSGYKGIYWENYTKKWRVQIGNNTRLGRFDNINEAIKTRELAEISLGYKADITRAILKKNNEWTSQS